MKKEKTKGKCGFKNCDKYVWYGVCNGYCEPHHQIKCMGKSPHQEGREIKRITDLK